jgi:predicted SAM-dependent methyltransferase
MTLDLPWQTTRVLLHAGCGDGPRDRVPAYFRAPGWKEIRLDIDPQVRPDVIGSITSMPAISDASVDAIWCSHSLEHVHSFDVPMALAEFRRVLKPEGFALITLPDLRAVARHVANDLLNEELYKSKAGSISALDVIFGHQASIAMGQKFMAHRTGFTARTLGEALNDAGFSEVRVHEGTRWDLWALATMPQTPASVFDELAEVLL